MTEQIDPSAQAAKGYNAGMKQILKQVQTQPAIQSSKLGFPEMLIILLVLFLILLGVLAIGRRVFRVR